MKEKGKYIGSVIMVIGIVMLVGNTIKSNETLDPETLVTLKDEPRIYDKQFDVRITPFHRKVVFHSVTTPVENMMQILQTMDSYNLCDEDWLIEMNGCIQTMKDQYIYHRNSVDPYIQKLMEHQLRLIQAMDELVKEADSQHVIKLEKAFANYYEQYQSSYEAGGEEDET